MRFSFFIFFAFSTALYAQNEQVLTKVDSTDILIKWYFKEFVFEKGVNIYRQEIGKNEWKKLNENPITPGSLISPVEYQKDSTLEIFINLFDNTKTEDFKGFTLLQFVLKSFQSKSFSKYVGIFWRDTSVALNSKYKYKINRIVNNGEVLMGISDEVTLNAPIEFLPPKEIESSSGENRVNFVWLPEEQRYYATNIYRKAANGDFKKVNNYPVMVSQSTNQEGEKVYPNVFFSDTGLINGQLYTYKFTAVDFFGDESEFSEIIVATPKDMTAPQAPRKLKKHVDKLKVKLNWECNYPEDFSEINIYRSTNDIAYKKITTSQAGIQFDEYIDIVPKPAGYYYQVGVMDKSGNEGISPKIFVEVADVFPPANPKNLKVIKDTARLILAWDSVKADDLYGYLIYRRTRTNSKTEFALINADPITQNFYIDSLPKKALNKFEYYVIAMDTSYNRSEPSTIAFNNMIDVNRPVVPVFQNVEITNEEIILFWIKNIDNDLLGYNMYRKTKSDSLSKFQKINAKIIDPKVNKFTDRWAEPNTMYAYCITAVDSSLNESEASNALYAQLLSVNVTNLEFELKAHYKKGKNQVELSWEEIDNSIGYIVFKSDSSQNFIPITGLLNKTKYLDEKLQLNQVCFYKAKSYLKSGEVAESDKQVVLISD